MEELKLDTKRPAIVLEETGFRLEMKHVDCVLIEKEEVISILKTLEGLKRRLQPLVSTK